MGSHRDVYALMQDGASVDRATQAAFADAVRRHREAGVPMAMWETGAAKVVSPFDIPLPGEDPAEVPRRQVQGAD